MGSTVELPMLPPGPGQHPALQALAYHRDPLGFLRHAQADHGPVFTVRQATMPPVVVVADPSELDQLISSDPHLAAAGSARRAVLPLASPRSPFGADGPGHADVRGRIIEAFAPDRVAGWRPELAALASAQVDRWPVRGPFRLLPRLRTLASTVTVRLALGLPDGPRARAAVASIRRMLWTPGNPPIPVPGEGDGWAGRAVDRIFEGRLRPLRHLLEQDGLDLDEWAVVLAAAQEPPAIAMTNVLLELARHPDVADRYMASPPEDPFRRGVVLEALRLRPAASGMLRRLHQDLEVSGHHLPAGTTVLVPSPLVHRDPVAFPDPDRFLPERWLGVEEHERPFWPFGDGARRCLGEALGRLELDVVVPAALAALRLRPAWPNPERMVVRGTVLVPHRSGLVHAERRRARADRSFTTGPAADSARRLGSARPRWVAAAS